MLDTDIIYNYDYILGRYTKLLITIIGHDLDMTFLLQYTPSPGQEDNQS